MFKISDDILDSFAAFEIIQFNKVSLKGILQQCNTGRLGLGGVSNQFNTLHKIYVLLFLPSCMFVRNLCVYKNTNYKPYLTLIYVSRNYNTWRFEKWVRAWLKEIFKLSENFLDFPSKILHNPNLLRECWSKLNFNNFDIPDIFKIDSKIFIIFLFSFFQNISFVIKKIYPLL